MRRLFKLISLRIYSLALLIIVGFGSFSVLAQKDILLYSTDFTDWNDSPVPSSSGTVVNFAGVGGTGFSSASSPIVGVYAPSATRGITWNSSGGTLTFRPFDFVSGGAVVLWVYGDGTNNRTFTVPGASSVGFDDVPRTNPSAQKYSDIYYAAAANNLGSGATTALQQTLDVTKIGLFAAGNVAQISKVGGLYKICYFFPSTYKGTQTITVTGLNKGYGIVGIQVYSGINGTAYVASTNYPKAPADGLVMSGSVGGAANSGVAVNSPVKIKEWVSTTDVKLSIVGIDSTRFSFSGAAADGSLTIPNAQVFNIEKTLSINFSPSVRAGVANAKLKIDAGTFAGKVIPPYYVSLTGITGGGAPQIVADTATIPFWTSVVEVATNSIRIAGLNLTNDITLSIVGANPGRFTLSTPIITKADALVGKTVSISYEGQISEMTENAILVISSINAATVKVPLKAVTSDLQPTLNTLKISVKPVGSGYINTSPAGTRFLSGSSVIATVTPETGWTVDYWQDAAGNNRYKRTFIIAGDMNDTVVLKKGIVDTTSTAPGGLTAYAATYILGDNNSIKASWSSVTGATSYVVKVYDSTKKLIQTLTAPTVTSSTIGSLSPGSYYYYSVETTVGAQTQNSGLVGPFRTTGDFTPFSCGQP